MIRIYIIKIKDEGREGEEQIKVVQREEIQHASTLVSLCIYGSIELNMSTWMKDSHGLYDYEAVESKCEK